jgi:hypothetical protein
LKDNEGQPFEKEKNSIEVKLVEAKISKDRTQGSKLFD